MDPCNAQQMRYFCFVLVWFGLHSRVVPQGFFRRAMSRKSTEAPFTCYFSFGCDVNRENRNKCRACRLRRCQEVGMIYGGTKENKRRRKTNSGSGGSSGCSSGVATSTAPASVEQQWRDYVVSAHMATFTPLSDIFMSRVID